MPGMPHIHSRRMRRSTAVMFGLAVICMWNTMRFIQMTGFEAEQVGQGCTRMQWGSVGA